MNLIIDVSAWSLINCSDWSEREFLLWRWSEPNQTVSINSTMLQRTGINFLRYYNLFYSVCSPCTRGDQSMTRIGYSRRISLVCSDSKSCCSNTDPGRATRKLERRGRQSVHGISVKSKIGQTGSVNMTENMKTKGKHETIDTTYLLGNPAISHICLTSVASIALPSCRTNCWAGPRLGDSAVERDRGRGCGIIQFRDLGSILHSISYLICLSSCYNMSHVITRVSCSSCCWCGVGAQFPCHRCCKVNCQVQRRNCGGGGRPHPCTAAVLQYCAMNCKDVQTFLMFTLTALHLFSWGQFDVVRIGGQFQAG